MIALLASLALMTAPQQGNRVPVATESAVESTQAFVACAANDLTLVQGLFGAMPGTSGESDAIAALLSKGCRTMGDFAVDPATVRGSMAEALFERDYGTLDGAARPGKVSMFTMPMPGSYQSLYPRTRYAIGMLAYGDCIVQAAPKESVAMMLTAPGSSNERTAFSALAPVMGECLNDGDKITFTRTQLRGVIAEAAYRKASGSK
ncbi:hypothetical protein P1X14_01390 [Sphingomonas sp. AOB5]|uniref:hypothetical protein n=1 Tax=Sphingomonas sp. AOB5 TaxID=3034017 RepID=UPI0023F7559A|nr:hypothetical protein [Sphingomonas sp. AOB5]MDF7773885.1 hypothetical protein [Sphingomonas sp. AOB5]